MTIMINLHKNIGPFDQQSDLPSIGRRRRSVCTIDIMFQQMKLYVYQQLQEMPQC